MLFVSTDDGEQSSWHVGEEFPFPADAVKTIQADGHELGRIFILFSHGDIISIPYSSRAVQKWYGDTAKTIAFALM